MSFFCKLRRRHYWSIPHRSEAGMLIQKCYECGSERSVCEVHKQEIDFVMRQTVNPRSSLGQSLLKLFVATK
jgi:hypothetical protein